MAVILPSTINADEVTGLPKYDAQTMRRNDGAAFTLESPGRVRTGVLGPEPDVSLSGSMVLVGPFPCVIGTNQGPYTTGLDSVTPAEGVIGVADAAHPRRDRVVLEVLDPDNGGPAGPRTGRLRVIRGEPAALPGLPPQPENSLHVCEVNVPRAGGDGPSVTINCPLTAAAGAPVPVRDQEERDKISPRVGQLVLRLDKAGAIEAGTGTSWVNSAPNIRSGYKIVTTNNDGYCTVPYDSPFPTGTTVAIPVGMTPPAGMTLVKFISGERAAANFLVTATGGEPLRRTSVAIAYIATGF